MNTLLKTALALSLATALPVTAADLDIRDDATCVALMEAFIAARPDLWNEDIGEES